MVFSWKNTYQRMKSTNGKSEKSRLRHSKKSKMKPVDFPKEGSIAWKIFSAFVTDTQIALSREELMIYAFEEMKLPKNSFCATALDHLPMLMVAYVNLWSGWHFKAEFLAGKFPKEHYFQRFHKFMLYRMTNVAKINIACMLKEIYKEVEATVGPTPGVSPYTLSIQCPAHMVNTIVFANSGDDIIMKQHLGTKWQELNTSQLINWPNIEVSFKSQDFYFIRKQATQYTRYLNYSPHDVHKNSDTIIEATECFGNQDRFSLNYLETYSKIYQEALKTLPEMEKSTLSDIQILLNTFLEDVRYLDVDNSMATNTTVLFNLSPMSFIRNKKLAKSAENDREDNKIGYCEIIKPKIQLRLTYFRPKQLETPEIAFEFTEKIKAAKPGDDLSELVPFIKYKCTFCNVECSGKNSREELMNHLRQEHKMEQHVRCTQCKKQYDVVNLTGCRWRHKCMTAPATSNSVTVIE